MEARKKIDVYGTTLLLKVGDITKEKVDAIVNAANARLLGGGGVDGAIHMAAGPSLLEECRKIGWCDPGNAVVTGAGELNAKYVIHTVGPIWRGGTFNEKNVLKKSYVNSLKRCVERQVKTVAFPAISTGAYGFPIDLAAQVSLCTIKDFLKEHTDIFQEIRIILYNQKILESFKKAMRNCCS